MEKNQIFETYDDDDDDDVCILTLWKKDWEMG